MMGLLSPTHPPSKTNTPAAMASHHLLHFRPKHHRHLLFRHFSSNKPNPNNQTSFPSDINSNPNPNPNPNNSNSNSNPNPNNQTSYPSDINSNTNPNPKNFSLDEIRKHFYEVYRRHQIESKEIANERIKKLLQEKKLKKLSNATPTFNCAPLYEHFIKLHNDKKSAAAQRTNVTPPKSTLSSMAATSNLSELKEACGSLAEAFKLLFSQEMIEEEGFLIRMEEECSQLRAKIDKREQTMNEADSFGPSHKVATDGHGCLFEIQMKDRQKLEALTAILVAAREGLKDKDRYVKLMEYDEDQEDD